MEEPVPEQPGLYTIIRRKHGEEEGGETVDGM